MKSIKEYRKALKISQDGLAKMLGVSQGAVAQWEKGKTHPAYDKLMKIAEVFGVSVDELMKKAG